MSRKPDEWMPLHIGDYHADTTHLTRDQHGAYFLLLMAYWRRGGALPADDGRLAAIVKATAAEWRKIKPVIAEFFTEQDGQWSQKRADEELSKAKRLTDAKAEAGRKGAAKTWQGHNKHDGKQMAEPSNSHRQIDTPLPLPTPIPKEEEKEDTSLRSVVVSRPKIEIPDWIPPEQWAGFIEMRKKIKAPITDHGVLLIISTLRRLRANGEDVGAVLDQSVMSSWRGVFPVKHGENNGTNGNRNNRPGAASASGSFASTMSSVVAERASERVFAGDGGEDGVNACGPITRADRQAAIDLEPRNDAGAMRRGAA